MSGAMKGDMDDSQSDAHQPKHQTQDQQHPDSLPFPLQVKSFPLQLVAPGIYRLPSAHIISLGGQIHSNFLPQSDCLVSYNSIVYLYSCQPSSLCFFPIPTGRRSRSLGRESCLGSVGVGHCSPSRTSSTTWLRPQPTTFFSSGH